MDEEAKEILQIAAKKFGKPDFVVSIYSMQFIWASEKAVRTLGYTTKEFLGIPVRKVLVFDNEELLKMTTKFFGKQKEDTKTLKKKSGGTVRAQGKVNSFIHKKEPYLAITSLKFL